MIQSPEALSARSPESLFPYTAGTAREVITAMVERQSNLSAQARIEQYLWRSSRERLLVS